MRLDYDAIAAIYDEPLRDHVADRHLVEFVDTRRATPERRLRVLDIGCGTGKQIAANRTRFHDVMMLGVDRFQGMLRIARDRCPRACWVQGDGAALPVVGGSFDYVTSQFSYQHVRRTPQLLGEIFRALTRGGRFVMTNIDPWSMPGWLVYRYFPEALALDQQDFLPVDAFVGTMRDAGFTEIAVDRADGSRSERLADFLAFASERHRASQMMAIPDAAYATGLDRLRADVLAGAGSDLQVRSEFVMVRISGSKGGGEPRT